MKMNALLFLLSLACGPFACSCEPAKNKLPDHFKITTKRDTDKLVATREDEKTVFTLQSETGIGTATIQRTSESWPKVILLRMKLKGLERFKATNGTRTLNASIASGDVQERIRLWENDLEETPLDDTSPLWTDLQLLDAMGQPINTIPLKEGTIQLRLPTALFEENPESINLEWIDFYR